MDQRVLRCGVFPRQALQLRSEIAKAQIIVQLRGIFSENIASDVELGRGNGSEKTDFRWGKHVFKACGDYPGWSSNLMSPKRKKLLFDGLNLNRDFDVVRCEFLSKTPGDVIGTALDNGLKIAAAHFALQAGVVVAIEQGGL